MHGCIVSRNLDVPNLSPNAAPNFKHQLQHNQFKALLTSPPFHFAPQPRFK